MYILVSHSYLYAQEHSKDFLKSYKGNRIILTTKEKLDGLGSYDKVNIITNDPENLTIIVPNYIKRSNILQIFDYYKKIILSKEYEEFIDTKKLKHLFNETNDITHTPTQYCIKCLISTF